MCCNERKLEKHLIGVGLAVGLVVIIVAGLLVWMQRTYGMKEARTFEVNPSSRSKRVLIATQGSEYKEAVVAGIVDFLETKSIYVKVTDMSHVGEVDPENWNAIVVLHTWEGWEPPPVIQSFFAMHYTPSRFVVLTTSRSGKERMQDVDAITGASRIENVPSDIEAVTERLAKILDSRNGTVCNQSLERAGPARGPTSSCISDTMLHGASDLKSVYLLRIALAIMER